MTDWVFAFAGAALAVTGVVWVVYAVLPLFLHLGSF